MLTPSQPDFFDRPANLVDRVLALDKWHSWYIALIVLSIILRVFVFVGSDPFWAKDTPSYVELASAISTFDYSGDEGKRTPGYPLLLLMFDINPAIVTAAQMCLGLVITSVLFWLAWRMTHNGLTAAVAGAFTGLNLWQIRFERFMMPETLVTLCLVLSLLFLGRLLLLQRKRVWIELFLMGASASGAALTKPLFLVLPVVLLIPVLAVKRLRVNAAAFVLPAFVPILAWSFFNLHRFDYFGLTTLTGFSLTNHSGAFIEYAPDEYAEYRDPYLRMRNDNNGDHLAVTWRLADTLVKKTGRSYADLSKSFQRMSVYLFIHHPFLYLKSVAFSWIKFMDARGSRDWIGARSKFWDALTGNYLWRIQWYILIVLSAVFLLLLPGVFKRALPRSRSDVDLLVATTACIVIIAQIVQALVESGDNTRYGAPFQTCVGLVVTIVAFRFIQARRS